MGPYEVEGIGYVPERSPVPRICSPYSCLRAFLFPCRYDFIPEVLDPEKPNIDQWIKTNDEESFAMVRQVM